MRHLTQLDLSRRWSVSPRTLEAWRWLGEGPVYLKLRGRILYRHEDVEAYEAQCVQQPVAATQLRVDRLPGLPQDGPVAHAVPRGALRKVG